MLSFFSKKDYWGNGLSVWVLAVLLFGTPFLVSILKKTEMNNEVEAWLPARDPQAVLLSWYNDNFPVKDRLFLSWDHSSLSDPRAELLAAKLEGYVDEKKVERRGSSYVEEVLTPRESLKQMLAQKVDQKEAVDSLTGLLVGQGALKVRLTPAGREHRIALEQQLVQAAKQQLEVDLTILPPEQEWQPPPEFGPVANLRQKELVVDEEAEIPPEEIPLQFEPIAPHDFQVTWHLIKTEAELTQKIQTLINELTLPGEPAGTLVEQTFFENGSPISLVVTLNEAGEADRSAAMEDIGRIAAECFIPVEDLHLGGRPVGSALLNEEVKKASYNPDAPWYLRSVMAASSLVSFVLAFFMVRSFRLGLLVQVASLYATMIAVCMIPLSGSTMNMVLIVMPTLLSVLTLSGAIHLVSYWKHSAQHLEGADAIISAVRMAAMPCFLASATTAIGLASLMTSTLNPVRDFGIFAAIGCGISLVFILFVLPALMQLWPGKAPQEREADVRTWQKLADLLIAHAPVVLVCCLAMFGVGIYGLRYFQTETKVVRYFQDDSRLITDYWFLEDNVVGVNTVDTIVRFDKQAQQDLMFLERMEIVRQITDKVRHHNEITGALSLADFQKVHVKPAENARFLEKIGYNKRSNELEARMKSGELTAANSMFTTAKRDTDWKEPGDRLLGREGDELWRISAQAYVMADNDYGALMDELEQISATELEPYQGTSHSVTGMVPVFLRTQEALLESLIWSFGMAFGIIAVVMMILLRSPTAGLISMLPNLLPVIFCFGVQSLMGIRVDIGTMITASVALGIAVDGTLHLLTWFKDGIQAGKTRVEAIELALAHCAPAMWQTSAIVSIGMLMLAPAPLLMISRFGMLMAALIMTALLADIVLLPALLTGTLGKIIENAEKRRQQRLGGPATDMPLLAPEPPILTSESKATDSKNQGDESFDEEDHAEQRESGTNSSITGPHRSSTKNLAKDQIKTR